MASCLTCGLALHLFLSQAGRKLEALYSEKGGVPVLYTSPYYVQLMDEVSLFKCTDNLRTLEGCLDGV